MFSGIFACLPFHFCVRIVDCYLVEGEKFLYRIALELAQLYEKHLKQSITIEGMREFCENLSSIITPSQLIINATKLSRLSRKGICFDCLDFFSNLKTNLVYISSDITSARSKARERSNEIKLFESPMIQRHGTK